MRVASQLHPGAENRPGGTSGRRETSGFTPGVNPSPLIISEFISQHRKYNRNIESHHYWSWWFTPVELSKDRTRSDSQLHRAAKIVEAAQRCTLEVDRS